MFFLVIVTPGIIHAQSVVVKAKSSYAGSWSNKDCELLSLVPGFQYATNPREQFTVYGTNKQIKTTATGYFYVKQINGRWWMIDPNGYAGINIGMNSLPNTDVQNNYDLLRSRGFNGIGNFLADEDQTDTYNGNAANGQKLFSYTRRINLFQNYKNNRHKYYSTPVEVQKNGDYVTVLDPKFESFCDSVANKFCTPYKGKKKYMLGYFTDNEIPFNQDQLYNLLSALSPGDPSYEAAKTFITSKGHSVSTVINSYNTIPEEIKREFAGVLADRYYECVSKAIKKYDPNHLVLGSRLHGRPRSIKQVVEAAGKWMDVVSVNFYDNWGPDDQITTQNWLTWAGKPCLVTEFYTKNIQSSTEEQEGAGWYVENHANRGKFYQNTCIDLLRSKQFIGWHYFKFQDDYKGMMNLNGQEFTDMTNYMTELNEQVYQLCKHFDSGTPLDKISFEDIKINTQNGGFYLSGIENNIPYFLYNVQGTLLQKGVIGNNEHIAVNKQGCFIISLLIDNHFIHKKLFINHF